MHLFNRDIHSRQHEIEQTYAQWSNESPRPHRHSGGVSIVRVNHDSYPANPGRPYWRNSVFKKNRILHWTFAIITSAEQHYSVLFTSWHLLLAPSIFESTQICLSGPVSRTHPTYAKSHNERHRWSLKNNILQVILPLGKTITCHDRVKNDRLSVTCPEDKVITGISFWYYLSRPDVVRSIRIFVYDKWSLSNKLVLSRLQRLK